MVNDNLVKLIINNIKYTFDYGEKELFKNGNLVYETKEILTCTFGDEYKIIFTACWDDDDKAIEVAVAIYYLASENGEDEFLEEFVVCLEDVDTICYVATHIANRYFGD